MANIAVVIVEIMDEEEVEKRFAGDNSLELVASTSLNHFGEILPICAKIKPDINKTVLFIKR